jgi:hypothetical protein
MFVTVIPDNLDDIPPGPQLAAVLASLEWEHISGYDLIRVLRAQHRQIAHYQAAQCWTTERIVAVYQDEYQDQYTTPTELQDGAAAEIGAALHMTRRAAETETSLAVTLCRHYPRVFQAVLLGSIDLYRAKIIIQHTMLLPDTTTQQVVEQVLDEAAALTPSQLHRRLEKLCIDVDPDTAKKRYDQSIQERRLIVEPSGSGTANILGMDLPPHDAAVIGKWIHREALKLKRLGDDRSMDQLRADIYLDLLKRRYVGGKITRADYGILDIKLTAGTLTGLTDESAELGGYGPILADIARQIVDHQQHTERRWTLIDPDTKQPIDGGITRRKPTTAQRRRAETLYPTCIHPGCRTPAVACDIDHRIPWRHRHLTCSCDLGPMCRHHHTIRHRYGWTYQLVNNGDIIHTTPLGHQYTTTGRPPKHARSP